MYADCDVLHAQNDKKFALPIVRKEVFTKKSWPEGQIPLYAYIGTAAVNGSEYWITDSEPAGRYAHVTLLDMP